MSPTASVPSALEARDYPRQISMQYNDVAPAEQERMRQVVKPVIEKFLATYDPAIQKRYLSESVRTQKPK